LLKVRKAEKFTPVEQTLPLSTGPNKLIFFCTHHPSLVYTSAQELVLFKRLRDLVSEQQGAGLSREWSQSNPGKILLSSFLTNTNLCKCGKHQELSLDRRIGGFQTQSYHRGEEKIHAPTGNQTLAVQTVAGNYTN
jgi:hypothetical protein